MTRAALSLLVFLTAGCGGVPTIKHCDNVAYTRVGNKVHIEADCRVPMGDGSDDMKLPAIMSAIMASMLFM